MDELIRLGVVAALANELAKYTQIRDVTLTEYVLNLWKTDRDAFKTELKEFGETVPDAVGTFIDRLEGKSSIKQEPTVKLETEIKFEPEIKLEDTKIKMEEAQVKFESPALQMPEIPEKSIPRDLLKIGTEYTGRVVNITKFGAFVNLVNVVPKTDGLIHISELAEHRVADVSEVVAKGDLVNARIIKIAGNRINLSLKPDRAEPTSKKRLTSPERFELRQMIDAGAESANNYVQDQDEEDVDDHIDVEIREDAPAFLSGEPVVFNAPLFAVPDGMLAKTVEKSIQSSKERMENKPKDQKVMDAWRNTLGPVGKVDKAPLNEQRAHLPVFEHRQRLLESVANNQIIIVVGETGSGKTTQIPQYLDEAGYSKDGQRIACTQPRRVAAVSIAERVANEMGVKVGDEVGYFIRFENVTSSKTRIKYMTDGMLEREILADPDLKQYSVIMLDEAHERTIATDILFALIKKALRRRPELRLLVTSATLNSEQFATYFGGDVPIFRIPGRTFPVEVIHAADPQTDYIENCLVTVMQIHMAHPDGGDILVFLTGQEEIDAACETLYERSKALENIMETKLVILPAYSALPSEIQSRIFEPTPPGMRKVIFATNIAETSITIDGIRYVVDPGFVKINVYDPQLGMDSLKVVPISKAQAQQRAGRAGRTAPGKCYRLYTQEAFDKEMLESTVPEVQRMNLAHTILMLKAMGIEDVLNFDFLDAPPRLAMLTAMGELYQLGSIDSEGLLTRLGRKMADFPMEPAMAKVLIESSDNGCAQEMLTIVAMLSMPTVFYRPQAKRNEADRSKLRFQDSTGDHLTLFNVYSRWASNGYSRNWCNDNYVHFRTMQRAKDVRQQLVKLMMRYRHKLTTSSDRNLILKVLCSGYFRNVARRQGDTYRTLVDGTDVAIHPASALFSKRVDIVIYHNLLLTSREYMHTVSVIKPGWLTAAAPTFYKAVAPVNSKRRREETLAPLHNKFAQHEDDWRISAQKKYVKYESTSFGR